MASHGKSGKRASRAGSALIVALLLGLGLVFPALMRSAAAESTAPSSTASTAVLVSHWPFDDGTGTTATNVVTPALNGVLDSGATWSTDVAPLLTANPYAVALNGATSVTIPDDDAIDFDTNQDFTIAFWTKPAGTQIPTGSNPDNAIIEKWTDGSTPYPYVVRYLNQLSGADEGKIFVARYDTNVGTGITSNVAINDGSYHHVAMVRGGGGSGTLSLYIDGDLQDTIPDVVSLPTTNSSPLFVGKRGNDVNFYSGLVDDLRIYNSALTSSEVAFLAAGCADTAATEAELNSGIACFNGLTTAGAYTIDLTADINLAASTTAINNNTAGVELTIEGNGHTIDGQDISGVRPFFIAGSTTVTLQNMTITGGNTTAAGGGAIYNLGNLTIKDSTLAGNASTQPGGAINSLLNSTLKISGSTLSGNTALTGGAISNTGTVSISNSTFSGNSASQEGGAILNTNPLTIRNSTFSGNSAGGSGGGDILNFGTSLTVANSILANSAGGGDCVDFGGTLSISYTLIEDGSCGISNGVNGNKTGDPALGPLQDNGGPTLTHYIPAGSPAVDAGDDALALDVDGATPLAADQRGAGFPRISGPAVDMGAFELSCLPITFPRLVGDEASLNEAITCFNSLTAAGTYTISLTNNINLTASTAAINNVNSTTGADLVIEGNGYTVDGQSLANVRPFQILLFTKVAMDHLTITGGMVSGAGGGITNTGFLTVQNSTISGNQASTAGGGLQNGGTLIVTNSTISGNEASISGGGISNQKTATVTNSTISGNQLAAGFAGIAIDSGDNSHLTVVNSTIADNAAPQQTVGIYIKNAESNLANTIIANGPTTKDCGGAGFTVTGASTLIEDSADACNLVNGVNGNITGQDPNLGPLQDNGGPTETMALLTGSPALDAGDDALALDENNAPLATDQRGVGFPRIVGAAVDIGAYEDICAGSTLTVSDEAELNNGITCYNGRTTAGTYTIALDADIALSASTTSIDNSTVGVDLLLDGAGFTVDGQAISGVRPFETLNSPVTMQHITISGGHATYGGAILNNAPLTLIESTLADNHATQEGGAIYGDGSLLIQSSTFSGNQADGNGGALLIYLDPAETAVITNSTISGNTAGSQGGGIYFGSAGATTTEVNNSTIAGNGATTSGGGIAVDSGIVSVNNSIIADSTSGGDCTNDGSGNTLNAIKSLFEDGFACINGTASDNVPGDPLLGPLQDNGGPTKTQMPDANSDVVDTGYTPISETVDQRGVPRPQGPSYDRGAVEFTGQAALSGVVALQGRGTPGTAGTVTISDAGAVMPDASVPYDAITGAFSFASIPVAPGGTDYDVTAVHGLYLANELAAQAVAADDDLDLGTTTLKGGDANNDGAINILDLGCMGGAYNTPGSTCGGAGGTDINADGTTNIQDLGIAGGNYNLSAPRPW